MENIKNYDKTNFADQFDSSEDFKRSKTKLRVMHESSVIDSTTGKILKEHKETSKIISTEPDYIKVYYKTMMAINNVDEIPLSFLLALSEQLNFTNGDEMYFYSNKITRRKIAEYCKLGDNMVNKYIKRCVDKGVFFTTETRGIYVVNPWLIAKGKWDHIRELQVNFEFVSGKWVRNVKVEQPENEESD